MSEEDFEQFLAANHAKVSLTADEAKTEESDTPSPPDDPQPEPKAARPSPKSNTRAGTLKSEANPSKPRTPTVDPDDAAEEW